MSRKPALSSYPRLHALLRTDPTALAQFNACLNEQQQSLISGSDPSSATAASLARSEQNLAQTLEKYQSLLRTTSKTRRLITLLGAAIEPQVSLRPYTQDLEERSTYEVKFDAGQLRLALSMYWDLLTREAEDKLMGSMDDETEVEEEF